MSQPTTIDAVLLSKAASYPDQRIFLRPIEDTVDTEVEPITYGAFNAHVGRLAGVWASLKEDIDVEVNGNGHAYPNGSTDGVANLVSEPLIVPKSIVGVYLPSGYTLCVVMFALIRLGAVPFCISPRNSDEALRHLVRVGKVSVVIASNDPEDGLAERMRNVLRDGDLNVKVVNVERKEVQDIPQAPYTSYPPLPEGTITRKDIAIQQHTSGSTAFPKPVPLSHEFLLRAMSGGTWYVEGHHSQSDVYVGQPPMFHMYGLIAGLLHPLKRGHTFAIPPLPPTDALAGGLAPSPRTLYDYARRMKAVELFGVTTAIVGVARLGSKSGDFEPDCEGIQYLKTLKRVVVGGAPIPRANGDWIVSQGVHLIEGFGSTEGGSLMHSNRPRGDPNWQGMRVCWNVAHEWRPFGTAPGTDIPLYELVLQSTDRWGWFSGSDPETGKFNTHDLFQEWPEQGSGRYRHFGRSDEMLLLSNGQNWNPRPTELRIEASSAIRHAVVFGHARPYLGALIEPKDLSSIDRDAIWAAIVEANSVAPINAQIAKHRVLVRIEQGVIFLDRDKPNGPVKTFKQLELDNSRAINGHGPNGSMTSAAKRKARQVAKRRAKRRALAASSRANEQATTNDTTQGYAVGGGIIYKAVKRIPIADKGTPLRPKTYALFKEEIDAVYDGEV